MSYKDDIDAAQAAVENEIGQVLSSHQVILDVKNRASQFTLTSNATVNSQAAAIISKANGLTANLQSIQADSMTAIDAANNIKANMAQDQTWKAILSDTSTIFAQAGWAQAAKAQNLIGQAVALAQSLVTIKNRADDHLSAVDSLKSDESALENYASGKGFKAEAATIFGGIGAGAAGTFSALKFVAVAVVAYYGYQVMRPFLGRRS